MSKVVIVGHGPSMQDSGLGEKIDSHDIVVRLKAGILNQDFGHKTNVLCTSTEVMGLFFKRVADEYWAYPKKGYFDAKLAFDVITKIQRPVMIPLDYCNSWNERFRRIGGQHPNVSTGMAAILIALLRYDIKEISLAGFDTLLDPTLDFKRHPDVPSTGLGEKAGHDWIKENELLNNLPLRVICLQ